MLRDKLLARIAEAGGAPDHQRLAAEVLGIRGASPELARRLDSRGIPRALVRDVVVVVPSVEPDSAELVCARGDGGSLIQRTRRNGADLAVHVRRLLRFFVSPLRRGFDAYPLAPIVFSWLGGRGAGATRLDPHDHLRARLAAVL